MSLEKAMSDLEDHIESAAYEFSSLRTYLEEELKDLNEEIRDLRDIRETLEAQNELLEEQIGEMTREKVFLELELAEVTNELIKLRHELDLSR